MADHSDFRIDVRKGSDLSEHEQAAWISLCTDAFEEDFQPYAATFSDPIHILAWRGVQLVSHAAWISRWLQIGLAPTDGPLLCTAYIEAVATALEYRNRGLASEILRLGIEAIARDTHYDIAALSPSDAYFYERLGWESWSGPLYARNHENVVAMPDDEEAMIYRLPATPDLDLALPISIEWREGEIW